MNDTLAVDGGLVEVVERLVHDHAADGLGQQPVAGEYVDFVAGAFQGDGVGGDKFLQSGVLHFLDGVAAEYGMGDHGADTLCTALLDDAGGFADGGAGVDDVVEQDDMLVPDIADEAHFTYLVGFVAVLVADDKAVVECLGVHAGAFAASHVGAGEHDVIYVELLADIGHEKGGTIQMVDGDVEESLNLVGVEVHADDPVGSGGLYHVGNYLGGDGDMGFVFAVLAGESVVGDDCHDFLRRGALGGVDHQQQLKEVVGRRNGGLDDEDGATTDGVFIRGLEFTVGILENGGIAQWNSVIIGYTVSQVCGCTARVNEYFISFFLAHFVLILRLQRYNIFLDYRVF